MRSMMLSLPFALGLLACASAAPPAQAGEWRLDPRLCPDLREDIRDRRVTYGRRDAREDRRDERVTRCPARAWVWVGDRPRTLPRKPTYDLYWGRDGRLYGRGRGRDIRVAVVIR